MVFCNMYVKLVMQSITSHNPYFNRWFSAIGKTVLDKKHKIKSQSLF